MCAGCSLPRRMLTATPRWRDAPGTAALVSVAPVGEEAETKEYPKQEGAGKGANVRDWAGEGG